MDLLQVGASAAAIAVLNAYKEIIDNKNWKPLGYTVGAGLVALGISYLMALDSSVAELTQAFVLGMGGSGVYTVATSVGKKAAEEVK